MKKIWRVFSACFFFLLPLLSFADLYRFDLGNLGVNPDLSNIESQFDTQMKEFGKMIPTALNSGWGQTLFDENIPLGIQFGIVRFDRQGIMANSDDSSAYTLFLSSGFSLWGFDLLLRAGGMPQEEDSTFFQGGLGYRVYLPVLSEKSVFLRPFVTAAGGKLSEVEGFFSLAAHLQACLNLDGFHAFVSGGLSYSQFDTTFYYSYYNGATYIPVVAPHTYQTLQPHVSLGAQISWISYEWTLMPEIAHSVGLTFYF